MKKRKEYLVPELDVLELREQDLLAASGDGDPYDYDEFAPLGAGGLLN